MDDALTIRGVRQRHDSGQGCWMKHLTTGVSFRALISTHPPIDLNTNLGYDPRMASMMEVMTDRVPESLSALDAKSNALIADSRNNQFRVATRVNSAVDCVYTFLIIQQQRDS